MVFDLDGGARHRWQGARRAAVTAELARVWLDPENGEKERGEQGREEESSAAASLIQQGGAQRGAGEEDTVERRHWRHAVHAMNRGGDATLRITPCPQLF